MSFDLFLMCARDGEQSSFKRELYEEIMRRDALAPPPDRLDLEYADESGGCVNGDEDEDIASLMFNHFGGDTFMERLWELADRTGSFFVWPGEGRTIAVTRAETISHIFHGLAESLGPPFVVRSGKELEYVIGYGIDPPARFESLTPNKKTAGRESIAAVISEVTQASLLKGEGKWLVDPYGIFASWAVRPESPERLARRMVQCLDSLSAVNPLLRGWLVSDRYPLLNEIAYENQHTMPFADARAKMIEIVKACAWRDRGTILAESLGYRLGAAVSDVSSSRFVEFTANAGGHAENGSGFRNAWLWTNRFADADPELVTYSVFKAALLVLVGAWEPEFAVARSSSLDRYSRKPLPFSPSWMTYLSAPLAAQIMPPSDVRVERDASGGVLMIATEERFEVSNPEHMAAARRICAAVALIDAGKEAVFNQRTYTDGNHPVKP
jgi:hypothetical protein